MKSKRKPIRILIVNNSEILANVEEANAIADQFSKAHLTTFEYTSSMDGKVSDIIATIELNNEPNNNMDSFTDLTEVKFFINMLTNSKAPGLDKRCNKVLKQLPNSAYSFVVKAFNVCIENCYFPKELMRAKVFPILKNMQIQNLHPVIGLSVC